MRLSSHFNGLHKLLLSRASLSRASRWRSRRSLARGLSYWRWTTYVRIAVSISFADQRPSEPRSRDRCDCGFHSGFKTTRPEDAKNICGRVLVAIGAGLHSAGLWWSFTIPQLVERNAVVWTTSIVENAA